MKELLRALQFLRLVDENNNLSITNIAVIGTTLTPFFMDELEPYMLLVLTAALVGYNFKKVVVAKKNPDKEKLDELIAAVDKLKSDVTAAQISKSIRR